MLGIEFYVVNFGEAVSSVNKVVGTVIGLAFAYLVEMAVEDTLASAGVDPRVVRVAGAIVGGIIG